MDDLAKVLALLEDPDTRKTLRFKNSAGLREDFDRELDALIERARAATDVIARAMIWNDLKALARRWRFEELLASVQAPLERGMLGELEAFRGYEQPPRPSAALPARLRPEPILTPASPPQAALESFEPPEKPLIAFPELRAPDVVRVTETFEVSVRTRNKPPREGAVGVAFPRSASGTATVVARVIVAPGAGLTVVGSDHASLEIPDDRDSVAVTFELRAERIGTWKVDVALEGPNSVEVTRLSRTVAVVEKISPDAPPIVAATGGMPMSFRALAAPGLVLKFTETGMKDSGGTTYLATLQGETARGPIPSCSEPKVVKAGGFARLADLCRGLLELEPLPEGEAREQRLENLGDKLAEDFLPPSVAGELAQAEHAEGASLHIESDDAWVPWEMLRVGDGASGTFLGERFAITRGLRVQSLRSEGRRGPAFLVDVLTGVLHATERERAALKALSGADPSLLSGFVEVGRALRRGTPAGIFHVACHGSSKGSPLGPTLKLSDGELSLADVPTMKRSTVSGLAVGALVFLNACESGTAADGGITRESSWPEAFMAGGAAACVATSWRVDTDVASAFAERVYALLGEGTTLAEAVRQSRASVRREGEPERLAWAVYAMPAFRLAPKETP